MRRARDNHAIARGRLVHALRDQGIVDERVLEAIGTVPRHRFVEPAREAEAYANYPLPIGHGQTISQPYIVALMTALLAPRPAMRVLEIGTGCGYQAAVLATIGCAVWSIEIVPALAERAVATLERLGHDVRVRVGDGHSGWPQEAPFDGILVAAAADEVPPALIDQLAPGGRLVIPVGPRTGGQDLLFLERSLDGHLDRRSVIPVRFVPLVRPEA